MSEELPVMNVKVDGVLQKFDGDPLPENLVEAITIEDGQIVKTEFYEDGKVVKTEYPHEGSND